jgi:cytidine deaminase
MSAEGGFVHLLPEADQALVHEATEAIRARYRYGRHTVGVAMRGGSGRIYAAVNLDATVGRAAVCAEAVALGAAVMAGEEAVEAVVAVRQHRPGERHGGEGHADEAPRVSIVSPCGLCRELLLDHAPEAMVIMPGRGRVPLKALLPGPYRR